MNFEERLLAELKTEAVLRAALKDARGSRKATGRRLLPAAAAAAIAGACALAAIVAPVFTGSQAAYAVTANADGSITVTINEFRDPDRLEKDLADHGARTDITYLPQRKRCAGTDRGTPVDPQPPPGTPMRSARMREWLSRYRADMPSLRALRWPSPRKTPKVFEIFPQFIEQGQTLVLELGESHTTKLWGLTFYLVSGPVRPCVPESDPYWN
jgi:hypothetical protein